jgi:tRNA threonylcarbamoyladenosine biosynthesis protein TsaB
MRILAIDTSLASGSVAATDDAGSATRPLGPQGEHARLLAKALAQVAEERGWPRERTAIASADVIAVVRGPGSFTGLRVGVTTAKALAWTTGARLVGVSGFEVVARTSARANGWADGSIEVAFDAGRGDVYAADVTPTGGRWKVAAPALVPLERWIESLPRGARVSGPALASCIDRLVARGDLAVAAPEHWLPTATEAACAARARAEAADVDDPRTLVPEYLRPSYAEEVRRPGA